ncbi:MAG: acyl-CoA dehydrogenase family protein [Pseudomonadales bacterium]
MGAQTAGFLDEQTVRREVRTWLEAHWDPELKLSEWRSMLADTGWGCPEWPKAWFGLDYPSSLANAVADEISQFGALGVARSGVRMLAAATLLEHGNDAQKTQFLRGILTGKDTWCQLFSEPGSGSDLAGLTTRADKQADHWLINGQKVWTTSAHHANYGMLLARTDWDVPKHRGLTYFVIDMEQAGVEVRPLKQMNGYASFNEVFFTEAIVPAERLVGKVDGGWSVALTTLANERRVADGMRAWGSVQKGEGAIFAELAAEMKTVNEPYRWYPQRAGRPDLVVSQGRETGVDRDPVIRQAIAELLMLEKASQWTARRAREAHKLGRPQGPEGSLGKLAASHVARAAAHAHTMIAGGQSLLAGEDGPLDGLIAEILLSVPAISIAGGTDEIQHNIIAERVLGMPKEPRADADLPFRDIPRN